MKYDNILQTIGHSPTVRLQRLGADSGSELWVKLERTNPGGSVKDRPALRMIEDAERDGRLQPGDTIIEPTSGNTGIGLAMVAAVKGYRSVFVMSEDMSQERVKILQAYGGEVILTPAEKGTVGAIEEARRLEQTYGYFFVGQHFNPSNPASHQTTAAEILADFGGGLDVVVCTTGTGGTISGLSRYLRKKWPNIEVVATEPSDSPILSQGIARKHKIMGTAPGFRPETLDMSAFDRILPIRWESAYQCARELATREGILSGISCGAAVAGMLQLTEEAAYHDKVILGILPDSGERYLSTDLWPASSPPPWPPGSPAMRTWPARIGRASRGLQGVDR